MCLQSSSKVAKTHHGYGLSEENLKHTDVALHLETNFLKEVA
jgi:hypothetical protein